jgi:hypothetical protein
MISRRTPNLSILSYRHDNDAKRCNVICDAGWNIQGNIDPNDVMNAFEQELKRNNKYILNEIGQKLKRRFQYLVFSDLSIDARMKYWLNSALHFTGDQSNCPWYQNDRHWNKVSDPDVELSEFL